METVKRNERTLAWDCYGDPAGRPLYVFHGFPGSGRQAALIEAPARRLGVCLVAIDRPGFGHSTRDPRRTILGFAQDVAVVADARGDKRFGVLGISCGGPYALACAYEWPARVRYTGLMAGVGPMERPDAKRGQLPMLRMLFALARLHRALPAPILALDRALFLRDPDRALASLAKLLTPPDRELLARDPEARATFAASFVDAYRQGIGGALDEARLIALPRGFAPEAIRAPVHVYQGALDRHVPPAMGRYLAQALPQGRLHFHTASGHLSIVRDAADTALGHFLEEFR